MYGAYLRKSRADLELEKNSGIDTLQRHRDIIKQTAEYMNITISKWYEEIVSGETIAARPEVQKMLLEVEQGIYEAILVVDVDRLARGDTADQARISKSFLYSATKIITPTKIYDPNNEADEEYFEFNLFMSRREYKIINKRLNRGRISSVNEGKFVGSICPFGYDKEKIKGQKGYKLIPHKDEAAIVKIIFQKACDELGTQKIANYLNELGAKPRKNDEWSPSSIRNIIQNEVYYGMIKWNFRRTEKKMYNGIVYKSRPKHNDFILVQGLHEALITKEVYDLANKNIRQKEGKSVTINQELQNPLAGLVKCAVCGRTMQRRNYRSGHIDGLICPRAHCENVGSHLYLVEKKILTSLKEILAEYNYIIENYKIDNSLSQDTNKDALNIINLELDKLKKQLNKTYDLLEQEIYDNSTFLQRSKTINLQIEKLEKEKKRYTCSSKNKVDKIRNVIPNIEKILENYHDELSPKEKNDFLKNVIEHIDYLKIKKGRGHEDEFSLKIHIKL